MALDRKGNTDWCRQERTLRVYLGHLDDVHVDRVLLPDDEAYERSGDELYRRRSRRRTHSFPRLVLPPRVRGRTLVQGTSAYRGRTRSAQGGDGTGEGSGGRRRKQYWLRKSREMHFLLIWPHNPQQN